MDNETDELLTDVKKLFCAANPKSEAFDVFLSSGCPATAIEELVAINCHHCSMDEAIEFFIARYNCKGVAQDKLVTALREILIYATNPVDVIDYAFISKLARLYLFYYSYIHDGIYEYPVLPSASRGGTVLIDLISGCDFSNFLNKISEDTAYYAVDKSLFVTEVIRQKAEYLNRSNVFTVNKNVLDLTREDISAIDIEIIRAKNIFTYVPSYLDVFHRHLDWLCDGGQFIFAEQSSEKDANDPFMNEMVVKTYFGLVSDGWSVGYYFGSKENPMALNSIWFTKGQQPDQQTELMKLQTFYSKLKNIYQY